MDDTVMTMSQLSNVLSDRHHANTNVPVYVSGSRDATHGEMVYVLDLVKRAGIDRVAFAVKADLSSGAGNK
jgi:biopolymer transport protein ExbD